MHLRILQTPLQRHKGIAVHLIEQHPRLEVGHCQTTGGSMIEELVHPTVHLCQRPAFHLHETLRRPSPKRHTTLRTHRQQRVGQRLHRRHRSLPRRRKRAYTPRLQRKHRGPLRREEPQLIVCPHPSIDRLLARPTLMSKLSRINIRNPRIRASVVVQNLPLAAHQPRQLLRIE